MQDDQILAELVRVLASVPDKPTFRHDLPENHSWVGAVVNILRYSDDPSLAASARTIASAVGDKPITVRDPQVRLKVLLEQAKREFELKSGYQVPINYVHLEDQQRSEIVDATKEVRLKTEQDNALSEEDRLILLSEIAIFEESLIQPRLSSDLINRFVFFVLKGTAILGAGELLHAAVGRLADLLLNALGWRG